MNDVRLKTVAKSLMSVLLAWLLGGCATGDKPRHPSDRKWYQGEMSNDERSFFLDSFFRN